MNAKKTKNIISFFLALVLLITMLPVNVFAANFSNCTISELTDYVFLDKNKLQEYSQSSKGVVVSASQQVYERTNGESMMDFPNVPYFSIGLNRDEGQIALLPSSAYLTVRYDSIGTYDGKEIGAFVTIKNPVNMTKLVLYSDFWYGCYLLEYGTGYGSADLEFQFFYTGNPNKIITLDSSYLTASSVASWAPTPTTMSYEGISFDSFNATKVWVKKDGLITQGNMNGKDLFYCATDINTSDKYVDTKGDPTYMNCGVMFQQSTSTWKCTPVVNRTDGGYGASWSYFTTQQLNFSQPENPTKTIIDNDNNNIYNIGDSITYEISQKINSLPEDGYGKYNKLEFIDNLPAEVDYVSANITVNNVALPASAGTLTYDSTAHKVTYTFSSSYLSALQYQGQTFKFSINCKINDKASQLATLTNKAVVLINDIQIESNTTNTSINYKITTEVENGTIDPSIYNISKGENKTISYSPNPGYMLESVTVDGVPQDITTFKDSYTFSNINANHHIKVVYKPIPNKILTITKVWQDWNDMYSVRPTSLNINVLQNNVKYFTVTLTSSNAITGDSNTWRTTVSVPQYDQYGNELAYTIQEDEANENIKYFYVTPTYDQSTLTVTNRAIYVPPVTQNGYLSYDIIVKKEIINNDGQKATATDFEKLKLDINSTYQFPIVLKEMNRTVNKVNNQLVESYSGYSGKTYQGIVTNKGDLIFKDIPAGKYEISENVVQYFTFVGIEKLDGTTGVKFSQENGKYFITISGLTASDEDITVKVTNKIDSFRPYDEKNSENNLFKK